VFPYLIYRRHISNRVMLFKCHTNYLHVTRYGEVIPVSCTIQPMSPPCTGKKQICHLLVDRWVTLICCFNIAAYIVSWWHSSFVFISCDDLIYSRFHSRRMSRAVRCTGAGSRRGDSAVSPWKRYFWILKIVLRKDVVNSVKLLGAWREGVVVTATKADGVSITS